MKGPRVIELRSGKLVAWVLPYGATLSGLWFAEHPNSLVLGAPEEEAYRNHLGYFGAIVGPIANRVSQACVTIGSQNWSLVANEGTTCLHSGPDGLHTRDWKVLERSAHSVVLRCDLEHLECGLPGNRVIHVSYGITDEATLSVDISATSDRDTMFNMAHHPYWSLDNNPTVSSHRLLVMADTYLPTTSRTLPSGAIASVSYTPYDFREARPLPTDVSLDANLCLADHRRDTPHPAAVLTGSTGVCLQIDTTEPGMQIYNGSGLVDVPVALHKNQTLRPCAGVALEPQGWPDAPHNALFPSIAVRAGTQYRQKTVYRISQKLPPIA